MFYTNGEVILDVSSCVICKRYVLCFVFEVVRLSPSGGLLRAGATSEEFFLFSPRAYADMAMMQQENKEVIMEKDWRDLTYYFPLLHIFVLLKPAGLCFSALCQLTGSPRRARWTRGEAGASPSRGRRGGRHIRTIIFCVARGEQGASFASIHSRFFFVFQRELL